MSGSIDTIPTPPSRRSPKCTLPSRPRGDFARPGPCTGDRIRAAVDAAHEMRARGPGAGRTAHPGGPARRPRRPTRPPGRSRHRTFRAPALPVQALRPRLHARASAASPAAARSDRPASDADARSPGPESRAVSVAMFSCFPFVDEPTRDLRSAPLFRASGIAASARRWAVAQSLLHAKGGTRLAAAQNGLEQGLVFWHGRCPASPSTLALARRLAVACVRRDGAARWGDRRHQAVPRRPPELRRRLAGGSNPSTWWPCSCSPARSGLLR